MCLTVCNKRKPPTRIITVFKRLKVTHRGVFRTPVMATRVKEGVLKADNPITQKTFHNGCVIASGAIHAYSNRKTAENDIRHTFDQVIVKCKASPKDFIAWGKYGEVAFTQITIPKGTFAKIRKSEQTRRIKNRITSEKVKLRYVSKQARKYERWIAQNKKQVVNVKKRLAKLKTALKKAKKASK